MRNVTILAACLFTASVSAAESNGEYIARISDCVACHTAEGGAAMAGGQKVSYSGGGHLFDQHYPGQGTGYW